MSCQKCDDFQDSEMTSCYRWKHANVEMRGCDEHLREIFDALNWAQRKMTGENIGIVEKEL